MPDETGYIDIDEHAAEIRELEEPSSIIYAILSLRNKQFNNRKANEIDNDYKNKLVESGRERVLS